MKEPNFNAIQIQYNCYTFYMTIKWLQIKKYYMAEKQPLKHLCFEAHSKKTHCK